MSSYIDTIQLDALLSEKFTERVQTTEHPVETGADPTDHARVLPGVLQLEAVITNTPIPKGDRDERGPAQQGRGGYAARTYKALQALVMGRAITVETPARTYSDMQITELARSRDSKVGTDSIQFTVQLKEIFFISTSSVPLERVTAVPKKPTSHEKQAKKVVEEADDRSILKKDLFDQVNLTNSYKGSGRWTP